MNSIICFTFMFIDMFFKFSYSLLLNLKTLFDKTFPLFLLSCCFLYLLPFKISLWLFTFFFVSLDFFLFSFLRCFSKHKLSINTLISQQLSFRFLLVFIYRGQSGSKISLVFNVFYLLLLLLLKHQLFVFFVHLWNNFLLFQLHSY